ncbi:forkhead box Q2 [Cottoperca gobio]|uniref:Forkhead box Q2 n=1 Tax=Cottoperca gobio TaxID=56716 RepID=A0A6J2PIP1_COTGO|nr:forkhead box protein D3-A-like [Cottoperca gobio]
MTMEDRSSCTGGRERLGLSFTIDYLLFNKGVKGSKEEATGSRTAEQTTNNMLNHPKPEEVGICSEIQEKRLQRSAAETEEREVKEEEGDEEQQEEGQEEVTTATSTSSGQEKSADKPNQSYIALISKAILASEQKKLLLCDIYQWIMDHYPYFKSKDKNWRNSVRHNLSLNDCFIKAGRSDNGKGHFWAIHPTNYQDFSNGDYHCRRARRRVRRVAGQLPLSSLRSPYHPAFTRPHRTTSYVIPEVRCLISPHQCLPPRGRVDLLIGSCDQTYGGTRHRPQLPGDKSRLVGFFPPPLFHRAEEPSSSTEEEVSSRH